MRTRDIQKGVVKAGTVVWKKCMSDRLINPETGFTEFVIVEMILLDDGVIPEDSRSPILIKKGVPHHFGRRCRGPKVYVKAMYPHTNICVYESPNVDPNPPVVARSSADTRFVYRVGEIVTPDEYDESSLNICTNGIHFFLTREEAEGY